MRRVAGERGGRKGWRWWLLLSNNFLVEQSIMGFLEFEHFLPTFRQDKMDFAYVNVTFLLY